ncbi:hypothetical protein [Novosphingobium sp. 9]|uniref:hypothetical protein n=1 Tax=Novosphingobium sp. 9 TaxID=2025349 RepID=UPI0021B4DD17|nr:hypothetical protein [Novosphingobium sp. 9]
MKKNGLSKRWCLFAIIMSMLVIPFETTKILDNLSLYDRTRYIIDSTAVIGLVSYAFRIALDPQAIWRVFSPVFVVFSGILFVQGLIRISTAQQSTIVSISAALFASLLAGPIVWLISLALLRQGGWLRQDSSATGHEQVFS